MTDAQMQQLQAAQCRLKRRLKTNILGQFKYSRVEVTQAFNAYCQLYSSLRPQSAAFSTPKQLEKAIKSKRPLSLEVVTHRMMLRVQNLENWSRWQPRDSPDFPRYLFDEYRRDYTLFCQKWPHLADTLPTPDDVERLPRQSQ